MATLLLADDSVTIQRVIELTFANESIRVVTAPDGHAATAMLEAERPDIMLADVGLPAVDGYTLTERLKRNPATAAIPVLLLTGAFEPIDEGRARRTGCNGVLVKPFEPHRVVGVVKALLAGQTPDNLWPNDMPRIDTPGQAPQAAADVPRPHAVRREPLAEPGAMPSPSAIEEVFEIGLDDLDLAFSRLDPVAPPSRIDADSVSDFQRDIEELRSVAPEPAWAPDPPRQLAKDVALHRSVEETPVHPIDIDGLDWDLPSTPATMIESVPLPPASPPPPTPPAPPVSAPMVLSTPWTPPAPSTPPAPEPPPVVVAPPPVFVAPPPPPPPSPAPPPPAPAPVLFAPVPPPVPEPQPVPEPPPAPEPSPAPAPEPPPVAAPMLFAPIAPPPPAPSAAAPAEVPQTSPVAPASAAPPAPAALPAPTLAAAFSALLAAEQSQPASGKPAATELSSSDAMVEAVVRRVAARLTGEVDRLVREELERLKR